MIINLCGRKRSGKGELSKVFSELYGAKILSFADGLKDLLCDILSVDRTELDLLKNNERKVKIPLSDEVILKIGNATGIDEETIDCELAYENISNVRSALQIIGTNLIRKHKPMWHVNKTIEKIKNSDYENNSFVVDDCRFYNEKIEMDKIGAHSYFIVRNNISSVSNHKSEISLKWYNFSEYNIIINDSTLEHLIKGWEIELNSLHKNSHCFNDIIYGYIKNLYKGNPYAFIDYTNYQNKNLANQIINNNFISDEGYIKTYGNEDLNSCIFGEKTNSDITFYNPLILENLKMYYNY